MGYPYKCMPDVESALKGKVLSNRNGNGYIRVDFVGYPCNPSWSKNRYLYVCGPAIYTDKSHSSESLQYYKEWTETIKFENDIGSYSASELVHTVLKTMPETTETALPNLHNTLDVIKDGISSVFNK